MGRGLSKSRFVEGQQCVRRLWLHVHAPDAPELDLDPEYRQALDRGTEVGEAARSFAGPGTLIEGGPEEIPQRIERTRRAIDAGAARLFEAAFEADGVFVACDLLERDPVDAEAWILGEVKSGTHVKDVYLQDVAIQLHVLRAAGLRVARAELVLLNRDCAFPDLSVLFLRHDVTEKVEPMLAAIPAQLEAEEAALAGALPVVDVGPHCFAPYECPFQPRCFAGEPHHHVGTLYALGPIRRFELEAEGVRTVVDVPDARLRNQVQRRQQRAVREDRMIVEPGLAGAFAPLARGRIGFLDFETVMLAIPRWPGCHPYDSIPAQFSLDVPAGDDGAIEHREWLATGDADPRAAFADALLAATYFLDGVIAWGAFEKRHIEELAAALPARRYALRALAERTHDLLPLVRGYVYHPAFRGSFSLKSVAPALVPGMGYEDLDLVGGRLAALEIANLLVRGAELPDDERASLRRRLLAYCARDTAALAAVFGVLRRLADAEAGQAGETGGASASA